MLTIEQPRADVVWDGQGGGPGGCLPEKDKVVGKTLVSIVKHLPEMFRYIAKGELPK